MNLILLPGNSGMNNAWIEELAQEFKQDYEKVEILKYSHWQTEKPLIDIEVEAKRLAEMANSLRDYHIIAKSAGCILTIYSVFHKLINPEKCYFIGTPIDWAHKNNFDIDTWIKSYAIPTLAVQKTEDTVISYQNLKEYVQKYKLDSITLKELPGDDHHYADVNQLKYLWNKF